MPVDGLGRRAQAGADARDELLGVERLDDVVVGSALEPLDDIGRVALGGEHDDGMPDSSRMRAHTSMPSMPGSMRSSSTRSGFDDRKAASAPVPSPQKMRLEALGAQHNADHLRKCGVIVNYQNSRVHLPSQLTEQSTPELGAGAFAQE